MSNVAPNARAQLQENVLFVDDEPQILRALKRLFKKASFQCHFAESGIEGLEMLKDIDIDLIVSDMRMPQMDGAEFLTKARQQFPAVKSILLTGHSDIASTITALNKGGIYRYISKPWEDEDLKLSIEEALKVKRLEREKHQLLVLTHRQNKKLKSFNSELEEKVKQRTEELSRTMELLDQSYNELIDSYDMFIRVFSSVISSRFQIEYQRPTLVAELAKDIASYLDLPKPIIQQVMYSGLLHELGKITLSDEILSMPEPELSREQLKEYIRYPDRGASILMNIKGLESCCEFITQHLENLDGSGYPNKLVANEMSYGAKILRISRDFIGLQLGLINKTQRDAKQAFSHIKGRSGKMYDLKLVNILQKLVDDYDLCSLSPNQSAMDVMALKPGMITATDIVNNFGILLISKGRVITEKNIEQLITIEKVEHCKLKLIVETDSIKDN
ncbi:HD domain-containing phosphohydrolase [Litoribacillus peritrichatus]|uniref:Response regulator n=1 Tax=Litoribacillus peritrichatus TaxID=718191 RepID=A0ABP7MF99_9GAMM